LHVRPIETVDHEAAHKIVIAADPFTWSQPNHWLLRTLKPHFKVAVAETEERRLLGVSMWTDKDPSACCVWVAPPDQRRGVGRALAAQVEQQQGNRSATCNIFSADPRGITFAEAQGFSVEPFRGGELVVTFVLEFSSLRLEVGSSTSPRVAPLDAYVDRLYSLALAFKRDQVDDEGVPTDTPEDFRQFCEGLRPGSSLCLLDEADQPIGFTLVQQRGSVAYTAATFIAPVHRRRGLARSLKVASFRASSKWATWAQTDCKRGNEPIVSLNRSLGMREAQWLSGTRS